MRELVYDILDAGPRQRFLIRSARQKRPLLVHNCTQAVARDVLAHGLLQAHAAGIEIVGHVHDEIIALAPEGASAAPLIAAMTERPSWAQDLPLRAAGYVAKRYRKD